jgi:hypothetical protein
VASTSPGPWASRYWPPATAWCCSPTGQPVRRGEAVGRLAAGHPGCVPAVCLHWGLRRPVAQGVQYLDPLRLVRYRVRLLPSE